MSDLAYRVVRHVDEDSAPLLMIHAASTDGNIVADLSTYPLVPSGVDIESLRATLQAMLQATYTTPIIDVPQRQGAIH